MAIIDKPTDYFNTVLYTGTGSEQSITMDFAPDLSGLKRRNGVGSHRLFDVVRGATKEIYTDGANAEGTEAQTLKSFNSNGFTLGTEGATNGSGNTYASWNWKAGGTASSNTSGSITSSVSANTTSGFSIVSYTGNETVSTIGHGLGVTPSMIIVKGRIAGRNWIVGHHTQGWTKSAMLDESNAFSSQTHWNNTAPTSSVFTIEGGTNSNVNTNNAGYIAYCFAEKQGYSKFASYTGTSSQIFNYTGFKPRFILIKKTSEGASWQLFDTKRTSSNGGNVLNYILYPNLSNSEDNDPYNYIDAYANGFRCFSGPSGQGTETNKNGQNFIYMAFAENPFVTSTGVPATAR